MIPHGVRGSARRGDNTAIGFSLLGHLPLDSAMVQLGSLGYLERPRVDVLTGGPAMPQLTALTSRHVGLLTMRAPHL